MLKIAHKREVKKYDLPHEVVVTIEEITTILDMEYGEDRQADTDGGFILVAKNKEDFKGLVKEGIDIEEIIPEWINRIPVYGQEDWLSILVLCNNEFGISIILPISITPKYLIEEIGEDEI